MYPIAKENVSVIKNIKSPFSIILLYYTFGHYRSQSSSSRLIPSKDFDIDVNSATPDIIKMPIMLKSINNLFFIY